MLKENKNVLSGLKNEFKEILKDYEEYLYTKNKETTVFDKKNLIKKYISSSTNIIQSQLEQIEVKMFDEWKNEIRELKVSVRRKNKIIAVMRDIVNYLYSREYIKEESKYKKIIIILDNIRETNSNIIQSQVNKSNSITYWTLEDYQKFNNVIDNEKWEVFFRILFYTGLRMGEIRAIKWIDLDTTNKSITVNKQVSNKTGYGCYDVISPKSQLSNRSIKLDDISYNMLLHYKDILLNEYKDTNYMFGNGNPPSASNIEITKNKYCKKANVKQIKIHDFRHSHCSMLIQTYLDNNMPINFVAIANRLGHTVKNTLDVYAHLYPKESDNLVNLLK